MKKQVIKVITICLIVMTKVISGQPMYLASSAQIYVSPMQVDNLLVNIFIDTQPYVQGGVTFTYPSLFFYSVPIVSITLEDLDMNFTSTNIVAAWVTQNTPTQTTVLAVTSDGSGGFQEIPTGSIVVHLTAAAAGDIHSN